LRWEDPHRERLLGFCQVPLVLARVFEGPACVDRAGIIRVRDYRCILALRVGVTELWYYRISWDGFGASLKLVAAVQVHLYWRSRWLKLYTSSAQLQAGEDCDGATHQFDRVAIGQRYREVRMHHWVG